MLKKLTFYSSVLFVYTFTISVIGTLLYSSFFFNTAAEATAIASPPPAHQKIPTAAIIADTPARITIPAYNIDLPIDIGRYDHITKQWTLSDDHAFFANISIPVNNTSGLSFIYGHGTDTVFGRLGAAAPPKGTIATIYGQNGHIFTYTLVGVANLKPNETNILKNRSKGPPRLLIQTCTGALSEWRTMYTFSLKDVK